MRHECRQEMRDLTSEELCNTPRQYWNTISGRDRESIETARWICRDSSCGCSPERNCSSISYQDYSFRLETTLGERWSRTHRISASTGRRLSRNPPDGPTRSPSAEACSHGTDSFSGGLRNCPFSLSFSELVPRVSTHWNKWPHTTSRFYLVFQRLPFAIRASRKKCSASLDFAWRKWISTKDFDSSVSTGRSEVQPVRRVDQIVAAVRCFHLDCEFSGPMHLWNPMEVLPDECCQWILCRRM